MRELTLEAVEFLRSAPAAAALDVLKDDPKPGLGALERLRKEFGTDPAAWLVDQARLRRRAEGKLPDGPLLLTEEALQMASGLEVARWRAARFGAYERVLDLGAGIGGDALALAGAGRFVVAVERDPVRAALLRHNAEVLGLAAQVEVRVGDWSQQSWRGEPAAFADPARRAEGKRMLGLTAMIPPLSAVLALARDVPAVLVKVAPGLDVQEVPPEAGLEFVSVGGELKEALLSFGELRRGGHGPLATLLPGGHELQAEGEEPAARVEAPGEWLYEPDPAVIRAGLVRPLGKRLNAWQLDPGIAYLSGDEEHDTPFARRWRVLRHGRFGGRKELTKWLRQDGAGAVTLKKRGVPVDTAALVRRLPKEKNGPPRTVIFSRSPIGPLMILAEAVS